MGLLDTVLGKLANAPQSLLFNAGLAGLASPTVSRYKRGPFEHFGGAYAAGSEMTSRAQENAMRNDLIREKIAENQRQVAAQEQMIKNITEGNVKLPPGVSPEQAVAAYRSDPDAFGKAYSAHLFPPAQDPMLQAKLLELGLEVEKLGGATKEAKAARETKLIGAGKAIKSARETGERIKDTPLAPGATGAPVFGAIVKGAEAISPFFPGAPAAAEHFTGANKQQLVDRETYSKSVTTLVNTLTPMASQGSGGSVLGLKLAEKASANLDIQYETARRILIQNTEQAIREAETQGIDIPDKEELIEGLEQMKADDKAFTEKGGKINQKVVDEYTPTPEQIAAEAKRRGDTIGVGPGGQVTTQPASVYRDLPEEGGDVEIPPTAAPAAAPAPPPGAAWAVPSFADVFGKTTTAATDAAATVAPILKGAVDAAVNKVKTVPIPAMPTQAEAVNAVQQAGADARPAIRQAVTAARDAGDKVAVVGNNLYSLGERKIGEVVNGIAVLNNKSDLALAKTLVSKGIRRAKVGTKYYLWRD